MAVSHLKKVMQGAVKSKRHNLFLNKRERDACTAGDISRLYKLSNQGFLGDDSKDSIVVNELMEKVYYKFFDEVSVVNFPIILLIITRPRRLTLSW